MNWVWHIIQTGPVATCSYESRRMPDHGLMTLWPEAAMTMIRPLHAQCSDSGVVPIHCPEHWVVFITDWLSNRLAKHPEAPHIIPQSQSWPWSHWEWSDDDGGDPLNLLEVAEWDYLHGWHDDDASRTWLREMRLNWELFHLGPFVCFLKVLPDVHFSTWSLLLGNYIYFVQVISTYRMSFQNINVMTK